MSKRRKRNKEGGYELNLDLFPKQSLALYTPGKLEILYGGKL